MLQFNFDATKGETPASIAQKRALVAQLMTGGRAPQNVGEGFSAIGDGIVANVLGARAEAADSEGRSSAQDIFRRLITGQGGAPTPSYDVASIGPQTASDATAAMGNTPAPSSVSFGGGQQEFIQSILPGALEASARTGIDPRIIIAQAAQESGWGKHAPGNNLFGIKSHGKPGGQELWTTEEINGQKVRVRDNFRAYESPSDSLSGYADFMLENPRYTSLREAQGLDAQLEALGASGYATDSGYANSVGAIARSLNLPELQGGSYAAPVQVAQGPDIAALMEAASNPFIMADPGMASVVNSLLQQQMQMSDPRVQQQLLAGQLGIEQAQLELEAMRNPAAPKPIEVGGVLLDPTTFEPIFDSRSDTGFTLSPGQQRFDAQGNPIASGQPEPVFRQLSPEEAASSNLDPSKAWQVGPDNRIYEIGGSGVNVTTNVAGGNKFDEAFATQDAAALSDISSAGIAAQRNLGRIDQLASLLEQAPNGFGALLAQRAGEFGIETEGLDTIQAAQAIINSLVPEQRQPGSGPMSDADLELFKQSLPRIINTPQGNQTIINTMRAIAQYDAEGAEIVRRLRAGEIDRSTAFDLLQSRQNPLQGFAAPSAAAPNQSTVPATDIDALLELYK